MNRPGAPDSSLPGEAVAARRTASLCALFVTVPLAADLMRTAVRGRLGVDLLAVAAAAGTVAVGENIASLIVVLMLSGGRGPAVPDTRVHP